MTPSKTDGEPIALTPDQCAEIHQVVADGKAKLAAHHAGAALNPAAILQLIESIFAAIESIFAKAPPAPVPVPAPPPAAAHV